MRELVWGLALAAVLAGGCATPLPPGSAGEVKGPLTSIELYTSQPEKGGFYSTFPRQRFYQSDRALWVAARWSLPDPGEYLSKVVLNPPTEGANRESEYRFHSERGDWVTYQHFSLPTGDEAKKLAGDWRVDVALNGSAVGTRIFHFEATSIRLRTDGQLHIDEGKADFEVGSGDYFWTDRFTVLELVRAIVPLVGRVLRDELSRRFPRVSGPGPTTEISGTALVLRPVFRGSPNPSVPSRLDLEISQPGTGTRHVFTFKSTAGIERSGEAGRVHFAVAASDLALQAGSDPAVLDFLTRLSNATPE